MKDLKYLIAYSIPICAIIGITNLNYYAWLTPIFAFVIIPILEIILPKNTYNLSNEEKESKLKNRIFDVLLYLNLPIVYGIIIYAVLILLKQNLVTYEYIGIIISVGTVLGANGINVAHELGHRQKTNERYIAKLLLIPTFYMHFYIEHNFGHHLNAATKEDPATAKYNQSVYSFWFTSIIGQYIKAWSIQLNLLKNNHRKFISIKNDMFWYTLILLTYVLLIAFIFNTDVLVFIIASGITGILLLETVNYIEHYGLLRAKTKTGRYERVMEKHSWNSNHVVGRIVLYELTRHSDHHYKSTKKYQTLDYHDISPQMPYGYPTSMVLSMIPPLWYKIMNKRIPKEMVELANS